MSLIRLRLPNLLKACNAASVLVSYVCGMLSPKLGETLEEREAGKTNEVNDRQLSACFPSITDWSRIVVAYEPVWAIGTGKVATPEMADEAHKHIRELVASKITKEIADDLRIVYGGSMNEKNAPELLKQANIDGGLIGGVSLKPGFCDVVATAHSI